MRDLVLTGADLVDGTGSPARPADLRVSDGRVREIGASGSMAGARDAEVRSVPGRVVCPGFIDLHSHGDLVLALEDAPLRGRLMEGRIAQGITTEIVGNCGLGPAPCRKAHEPLLRGVLSWMTPSASPWPWRDVGGYLDHLESTGVPVNVGTLVAHGALRIAEAGLARELPSASSAASMAADLDRALGQGAFGMSLGLIYPPGSFTAGEEIAALAPVAGRHGALVTAHIRGSSETLLPAVEELLALGRGTGARIHHSHSEAVGPEHWEKIPKVLEAEERARREGVPVTFDMFPYTAAATTMAAIYPPWALESGLPALVARLRDPETRDRIRRDVENVSPEWPPWGEGGWAHNLVLAVGWERITVGTVHSDEARWAEGLSLAALGDQAGTDPFEAIADLMIREEGRVSQIIHGISGEEGSDAGLVSLLRDPHGAVCTDANDMGRGLPHPAAYGTFPRVLGHFVRERKALGLEEAIRKMTSYPAEILGLPDRGVIRPGAAADLVVFDPAAIGSEATYREPRKLAAGIALVLVNGVPAFEEGQALVGSPGRVLRK